MNHYINVRLDYIQYLENNRREWGSHNPALSTRQEVGKCFTKDQFSEKEEADSGLNKTGCPYAIKH